MGILENGPGKLVSADTHVRSREPLLTGIKASEFICGRGRGRLAR
jgi:hypothetical protein